MLIELIGTLITSNIELFPDSMDNIVDFPLPLRPTIVKKLSCVLKSGISWVSRSLCLPDDSKVPKTFPKSGDELKLISHIEDSKVFSSGEQRSTVNVSLMSRFPECIWLISPEQASAPLSSDRKQEKFV